MADLVFSLNATVPVFLMIVLGGLFRKLGIFDDHFVSKMNTFVFLIPLPVMLFRDLATEDFSKAWDGRYVVFCAVVTLLSIFIAFLIAIPLKNRGMKGEFIQASYRSSAAILGIAFISNIYGNSGMAPLMIIGTVPLYNIFAVIVLMLTAEGEDGRKNKLTPARVLKILKGVATNPIILGILAGLLWSVLGLPFPAILDKTTENVARVATPMGLMAMGGAFRFSSFRKVLKPAAAATVMKLFGFVGLFLPLAIRLGFRKSELVAILVMLGSASTVTCYTMAINMKHDGALSSAVVTLTTLGSAFSLTLWLFILKSMGLV